MKIITGIAAFSCAVLLSIIAAYYSVTGMVALFPAAPIAVVVMMSTLELSKVVTATWLHSHWKNPGLRILHRSYLIAAVGILMSLTSIGIYGLLSAAHLEQNAPVEGLKIESSGMEQHLVQKQAENGQYQTRLDQINKNIDSFLGQDQATKGLKASERLATERVDIQKKIDANNTVINDLNTKLAPLHAKTSAQEAKLGPVKYVADAIGFSNPEDAVRIIIVLIMIAFDPLAICLIIAGSIALASNRQPTPRVEEPVAIEEAIEPVLESPVVEEEIEPPNDFQNVLAILERNPTILEDIVNAIRENVDPIVPVTTENEEESSEKPESVDDETPSLMIRKSPE